MLFDRHRYIHSFTLFIRPTVFRCEVYVKWFSTAARGLFVD